MCKLWGWNVKKQENLLLDFFRKTAMRIAHGHGGHHSRQTHYSAITGGA
jgi:hypothetical protein